MKNHLHVAFLSALVAPYWITLWLKVGTPGALRSTLQCELMTVDACKTCTISHAEPVIFLLISDVPFHNSVPKISNRPPSCF